jgi:hypothetical protein
MLSIVPLLLSAVLLTPAVGPFVEPFTEGALLDAPTRRIRTTDHSVRKLLKRGYKQSAAFRDMVTRLQRSDVYVYVEEVPRLPGALEGRLMILPKAHGHRYLRIQLTLRGPMDDSVALLGHELQHAVEIADAVEVSDERGMEALYTRIGVRGGAHIYDTFAAQEMGRRIRRELMLVA